MNILITAGCPRPPAKTTFWEDVNEIQKVDLLMIEDGDRDKGSFVAQLLGELAVQRKKQPRPNLIRYYASVIKNCRNRVYFNAEITQNISIPSLLPA